MDVLTPWQRSYCMSRIRGKDTAPELYVRRVAHAQGLRFRLHREGLPGRPDLVFPGKGIALFIHGCFWHRHSGCPKASTPATNVAQWNVKFDKNVDRDRRVTAELEALGWRVVVIWECETKDPDVIAQILQEQVIDHPAPLASWKSRKVRG